MREFADQTKTSSAATTDISSATRVRPKDSRHRLLELQRAAGNEAVVEMLAPAVRGAAGARAPGGRAPGVVQREAILEAAMATGTEPGKVAALTPDELTNINVEASIELRRLAGNAIGSAVEQFHRGCDAVKSELEKRAKQQAELVALVADIMAGFAVPALAGKLVADAALRRTLADAGKRARIGDLGAMVNEINALQTLKDRGAGLNPSFWDKVSGDNIKATFTGAVKSATTAIKNAGPGLLTGSKPKVIAELSQLATLGRQDLDRSLATKSESELLAIIVALDASNANETVYATAIKHYLEEIIPIGSSWTSQVGGGTNKLVKVNAYGGWRLAVVESGTAGMIFGTPFNDFKAWVSPGMQNGALARAGLPVQSSPLEVVIGMVPVLDPSTISNHIPAPSAEDSAILP